MTDAAAIWSVPFTLAGIGEVYSEEGGHMHPQILKAGTLEKMGRYREALEVYQSISPVNVSPSGRVFISRSIASCLFYLKRYQEAESVFQEIIDNEYIDPATRGELNDSLHMCRLYGGSPESAVTYFQKRLRNDGGRNPNSCWWHWYSGRAYQIMTDYRHARQEYDKASRAAEVLRHDNAPFFHLYTIVPVLFENDLKRAARIGKEYTSHYGEVSCNGLYEILFGLIRMDELPEEGRSLFDEGVERAEQSEWPENADLGREILALLYPDNSK